jgi:SAM-dependent methyltransferase
MAPNTERKSKLGSIEAQVVEERLMAVYTLAGQEILARRGRSALHLDIGTYTGFALEKIHTFADHIVSFDLDQDRLFKKARKQPWVVHHPKNISLLTMMAQNLGIADSSVDSVTCVEVFGAGFEGKKSEVQSVFEEMSRVLKPGGIAVFTVKSETMDRVLSSISGFANDKGYPVNQRTIFSILHNSFSNIHWYGQILLKYDPKNYPPTLSIPVVLNHRNGHIFPIIEPDIFTPTKIEMRFSDDNAQDFLHGNMTWPRYWIGVAQKAES